MQAQIAAEIARSAAEHARAIAAAREMRRRGRPGDAARYLSWAGLWRADAARSARWIRVGWGSLA